jgi:WD40 repeat protein
MGVVIVAAIVWGIGSSMATAADPSHVIVQTLSTQTINPLRELLTTQIITQLTKVVATQTPDSDFMIDSYGNSVMHIEKGDLYQIAYSPDRKYLAAASSIGIFIYDADLLSEVQFLNTGKLVNSIAFSPDGQLLASGSQNAAIHLWNINTGELLHTMDSHSDDVEEISFLQDGRRLVSISGNIIEIWDVGSGTQLDSCELSPWGGINETFSPDGRFLATSHNDDTLRVWDIEYGYLVHKWKNYSYISIAFSMDGYWIAYGKDGIVHLIIADCGLESYSSFSGGRNLTFSVDGEKLASTNLDDVITILDVDSGKVSRLIESPSRVVSLAFSPNGTRIAFGTEEGTIHIWNIVQEGDNQNSIVPTTVPTGTSTPGFILTSTRIESTRLPTWTSVPVYPTNPPQPTATLFPILPTNTPKPTYTPYYTSTPLPTHTPITPLPTDTPVPPLPSVTPVPT